MTVPDYQSLMFPLLAFCNDSNEHNAQEAIDALAIQFQLTATEKNELLPSGKQTRFANRMGWARTYLKKAKLIESTARGKFKITERGKQLLKTNHEQKISAKDLEQFAEYLEFKKQSNSNSDPQNSAPSTTEETPQEQLESSYQTLRLELAQDILQRLKTCSPQFFERVVLDLLVAIGYGGSRKDAAQAVGQSGDGGIDGIIKEDKLGLDVIYIQAKRWEGTVGRPVVQGFTGSLEGFRARRGILMTTSKFSKEAWEYVEQIEKRIVLIDGEAMAQLMVDYNVGVTEIARYTLKKADSDYFEED